MFADGDPCPCESGLLVRDCRCKSRSFVPVTANTTPPSPVMGLNLSRCYAGALSDCSSKLSAEHPLSLGVIEQIAGASKFLNVTGRFWQRDPTQFDPIGLPNLKKKVLCQRHNSALSPLDGEAGRFMRAYSDAIIHMHQNTPGNFHRLFNGFDLERWMLKVICALQFRETIPGSLDPTLWRVPRKWLDILFGNDRFPGGCGLYIGKRRDFRPGAEFTIGTDRTYLTYRRSTGTGLPIVGSPLIKVLAGVRVFILDLELELYLIRPPNVEDYVYRPRMLRFPASQDRVAYLHLAWEEHPPTFKEEVVSRNESYISQDGAKRALERKLALAQKK
jgi:hypothetical protein